jgi:hypothetical protein
LKAYLTYFILDLERATSRAEWVHRFVIVLDHFPYHGHDLLGLVRDPLYRLPSSDLSHDTSAPFLEVTHPMERSKHTLSRPRAKAIHLP